MYLAIKDEVITKMQKWVKDENDKMINEWNALPWYKKLGGNDHIHRTMMARWAGFRMWMNERMAEMKAADPDPFGMEAFRNATKKVNDTKA